MSATTPTATTSTSASACAPGASTSSPLPTSSPTSPSEARPTASPVTPAAPTRLIAMAFTSFDPKEKKLRIRPAVASSLSPLTIIAATPSAASAHTSEGVVAAFNAATDLVMYLDEQLTHPPSMGETLTGLFRPASAEQGQRLKKLGEKIKSGHVKVPVGKGGEAWEGDRRVEGMGWEEFEKVFLKE